MVLSRWPVADMDVDALDAEAPFAHGPDRRHEAVTFPRIWTHDLRMLGALPLCR